MSTLTSLIPPAVEKHLEDVIKTFGLDRDADTLARLKSGWLEKEEAFKEQMFNMGMEETDHFDSYDERGV
ncbi:MAG: hypothetical protein PQJ60_11515, partial [Spirochaetales bacterium]|nr:hypothetical protein [Spirochaetales bacterium]